jgi:hypothetical protein
VNGWIKSLAGMAQTKHRGLPRVRWMFQLKVAAYNLIRLPGCWSQHKCAHLSSQLSLGCPAKDRQFPDHNINPLSLSNPRLAQEFFSSLLEPQAGSPVGQLLLRLSGRFG